jgi:hypothetical protein
MFVCFFAGDFDLHVSFAAAAAAVGVLSAL